jgi:hypothetical protein
LLDAVGNGQSPLILSKPCLMTPAILFCRSLRNC